jgi:hypothetical protein
MASTLIRTYSSNLRTSGPPTSLKRTILGITETVRGVVGVPASLSHDANLRTIALSPVNQVMWWRPSPCVASQVRETHMGYHPFSGFTTNFTSWRLRMSNAYDCARQITANPWQGAGSMGQFLERFFDQTKPNPQPRTGPQYAPLRIRLPQVP